MRGPVRGLKNPFVSLMTFALLLSVFLCGPAALAQKPSLLNEDPAAYRPGLLLAQADFEDSYDPFSDYSEFDEASEEEADVYFFRHGRFFTIGLALGQRFFTDKMGALYKAAPTYGIFLTFFFDLRLALQFGFSVGDHAFSFPTSSGSPVEGNVGFTILHMNLKHYFNTQNMTRGLSDLNPYIIGGIEQVFRTYTTSTTAGLAEGKDSTLGLNFGGGIEVPFNRKRSFFGIQGNYHYVQFKDENANLTSPETGAAITSKVSGDTFDIMGIIGINY